MAHQDEKDLDRRFASHEPVQPEDVNPGRADTGCPDHGQEGLSGDGVSGGGPETRADEAVGPFPGEHRWLTFVVVVTGVVAAALIILVIIPGYKNPSSRIYTSRFGYASLLRAQGRPFPVTSAKGQRRTLSRVVLGEGVMRSESIQVAIIPAGRILRVPVAEGDRLRKGQLLAEVDPGRALIHLEDARDLIETAKAELERIRIGSHSLEGDRRPGVAVELRNIAEREAAIRDAIGAIEGDLATRGLDELEVKRSTLQLALHRARLAEIRTRLQLRQAEIDPDAARKRLEQSVRIGEIAVREAERVARLRASELKEFRVVSPIDGVLERCLVHAGEYNRDLGQPAFSIAAGGWFEAHFDQGTMGQVRADDSAEIRLEALNGRPLAGRVTSVHPFIHFRLGGPEADRPIRPMGTGSPEWPATYRTHIRILDQDEKLEFPLVPGLTGFARIVREFECLALPLASITAVSGGKGLVHLVRGDRFELREVTLGVTDGDWTEVRAGLSRGDEVIVEGHQVLMPGDLIDVIKREPKGH